MNISSVIVIPSQDKTEAVIAALKSTAGVEVAVVSDGKIIITIETPDNGETVRTFEFITTMEGVLSASMVYHQFETDPEVEISVAA